ncbi:MAG TPA: CHRD domain-containing protein [Trueperaceae bacterium]|nr:CHRD domain-containing protein [Trueperaceae bacterium]
MKRLVIVTLSVLGVLLIAAGCKPALTPTTFEVVLSGADEVPANASTAVGSANVTVVGNRLAIDGAWDGFDIVDPGAHVHGPAAAGANAGILFELAYDNAAKTFEGTFTMNADQMAYFLAGELYINLHSAAFPNGEIRGQIDQ